MAGDPDGARADDHLHRAAEARRRRPALLGGAREGVARGDVLHASALRDADARARGAHTADDRDAAGAASGLGRQPVLPHLERPARGLGGRKALTTGRSPTTPVVPRRTTPLTWRGGR